MKSITPLILIVLSLVIGYFYLWPQYLVIAALRTNLAVLSDTVGKVKQIDTLHNQLIASINGISPENTNKISRVIPAVYNPTKLVSDIEALAGQHGLILSLVTTQIPVDPTRSAVIGPGVPYRTVQLTLAMKGSYAGLYGFLRSIESSVQLLDVRKINVSVVTTVGGGQETMFDITIDTYWGQ